MDVTILCSEYTHPINARLDEFCEINRSGHKIQVIRNTSEIVGGDVLFLVSCHEVIGIRERNRFKQVFVLHASDLPRGRGWSPHIWQILEGKSEIIVSLLEAEDDVDTGRIWGQLKVKIPETALYDTINDKIFDAQINLMQTILDSFEDIKPRLQSTEIEPSYYRKRTPQDSKLDVNKNIQDQFDLLRICDPQRYPAYFELYGETFKLTIEKVSDDD